jgi:hypothetical protein
MKKFIAILALLFCIQFIYAGAQVRDKIFLSDGQILTGSLANSSFQFNTIYGNITVPNQAASKIERVSGAIELLETVNNEKISGYIANEYLELQISGGPKINVRKELINKIIFAPRDSMRATMNDYFVMKNGDVFYGKVLDTSFQFTTSYGTINTAFSNLLKLEDNNGQTIMNLADGNSLMGYISTNYINITTNYGFQMRIPKSSIKIVQMR